MTPKEKAIDLYSKYYNRIEHTLSEEYSKHEKDVVKECALVTIDEILSVLWHSIDDVKYFQNVKTEIENL